MGMTSFLEDVVAEVEMKYETFEDLIFVLPSKRAGTFLRKALAEKADKTFFAPDIYSIEEFIEKISGLAYATQTQQLFYLYKTYISRKPDPQDNFYSFSKWGQTLLQDINEIDRYLIDAEKLFDSLSDIQEMEHWSLRPGKTQMMEDYLRFWNDLGPIYRNFNHTLLSDGLGHQGLVYRTACDKLEEYLTHKPAKVFIFLGFNALNTAESQIIQQILDTCPAEIFWDIDTYFLNDAVHDASYFIRQHGKTWPYLAARGIKGVSEHYLSEKKIKIIGMPKNVSQSKYTGQLLYDLHQGHPGGLKSTAVVLGEESLLNSLLNAIPPEIEGVNITMGYPLHKTPLATFFEMFIALYINRSNQGWFYRDILDFLAHPSTIALLNAKDDPIKETIQTRIKSKNWIYIKASRLWACTHRNDKTLKLVFHENNPNPQEIVQIGLNIIAELRTRPQNRASPLGMEYLYRFYELFNQLDALLGTYNFIDDLKSLQSLYRELLSSETLDFQGEPLQGLQIMGMLESRNLDFDTVIITSVNEGILPSGKSNNSFIPFDLKLHSNLPTYKEKDAVYTYHFYRLLQRAKQVYILYSTEPDDGLGGGERSRLIDQLLTDGNRLQHIVETQASPSISPSLKHLKQIEKDASLLDLIKSHAAKGFSPTSLSNYIRNPLEFYRRYVLGIDDVLEVEETLAANTFGTIVHDTLEDLYRPFLGKYLTVEGLKTAKADSKGIIEHHFKKSYGDGDISRGKNLIAFHVIHRYIENFIDQEMENFKHHRIKLLGLEEKLQVSLDIPGIDFTVNLKGKLDRIDEMDGNVRIIDYKTGKVTPAQVEIVAWEDIASNYDHSKAFQILCYTLMYHRKNPISSIEAGIVSFKNLGAGLMRFATKPSKRSRAKDTNITQATLDQFGQELSNLVLEICNPDIPFIEKEV